MRQAQIAHSTQRHGLARHVGRERPESGQGLHMTQQGSIRPRQSYPCLSLDVHGVSQGLFPGQPLPGAQYHPRNTFENWNRHCPMKNDFNDAPFEGSQTFFLRLFPRRHPGPQRQCQ